MVKNKYVSALKNSNYVATVLFLGAAGLMVSNMLLSYKVATTDSKEKTIIVPAGFNKTFSVQGNDASVEYIELMSRYFIQLLLTYQKLTVNNQFDEVLRNTSPDIYGQMKIRFLEEEDRISRNDMSSVFYVMGIYIKKNTSYLTGELRTTVGSVSVAKNIKTYQLGFSYENGKLVLTAFNEVHKNSNGDYEITLQRDDMMVSAPDKEPTIENEPITPSQGTANEK